MLTFGFPPIASPAARVLIVGSLPGRQSVERAQYYANPQNAFWKIIAAGIPTLPMDYAGRVASLTEHRIAVWDVLAAATRSGSLDASIGKDAVQNNFRAFFQAFPRIERLYFNGATAATLYARRVLPTLPDTRRSLNRQTLPSTSGAHASLSLAEKIRRWSVIWE